MYRLAVLSALLVLLSGCASADRDYWQPMPESAQAPELARIHFYRPEAAFLWAAEPQVIVNEKRVGRLRNGETFYRDARPGRYRIYLVGAEDDVVEAVLKAGDRIYVKADIAWRVLGFRFVTEPASAAQAEPEIANLQRVTGLESDLRRSNPPPPDLDPRPDI
ncbi:DUF2846 domain-containing protein [Algihabitans albus]|uniref:DUF2846 domain-containing protein n=1 Tax=Algihabitans albus TaxID=2164067 RepID=UPI000E5D7493|nr:DUF2846 domain-containing protein [Algihabitans albus]